MKIIKPSFEIEDMNISPLLKIERAGRTCYKSEDKITDDSSRGFARRLIKSGHHSVLEHATATVRFIVDRGISHELVRHRLASFSQESTRYCKYGDLTFILPPWVDGGLDGMEVAYCKPLPENLSNVDQLWVNEMLMAELAYDEMLREGWRPEQARIVLPNSLKTEVVMTANFREWRHVFALRCSKAAHPQMREVMVPLLAEFRRLVPVIFDDLEV